MTDPLIAQLEAEREATYVRLLAIDEAIKALTGTAPLDSPGLARRQGGSVGPDKVDAVRAFIKKEGEVRQAEIAQRLNLNTGIVSNATRELLRSGEIEELPKRDRSRVWRSKM